MPWWGKSEEQKTEHEQPVNTGASPNGAFDPQKLPVAKKLPKNLQKIVDKSEQDPDFFYDADDGIDSTDSNIRFAGYAQRLRTILLSAQRYTAFSSEVGESFRPVAHPNLVRAAYGISWAYIIGDVSFTGYKEYWRNQRILNPQLQLTPKQEQITGLPAVGASDVRAGRVTPLEDYRTAMVQRAIFQTLASMALPAFTVHTVVRYSGVAMKNMKNKTVRAWGPVGLGLATIPFLPIMFDEPVEHAVEWVFHKGFQTFAGEGSAEHSKVLHKSKAVKEKEL